jgi:16S rRNA (cytosine967-C5)-methyltransferase
MPVSAARRIAFDVLLRVESESAYASELLHSALTPHIKPADAGLATELTLGVLRWRRLLDFLLDRQLKKPATKLDLPVAVALRIGLYQLRFLEKIPARAAVNESVELVKRARKSSAAALVNAVLRRASQDARSPLEKLVPQDLAVAERLGILLSHPAWLTERWLAKFGERATVVLLESNNRAPRTAFAIRDSADRENIVHELESSGLRIERGRLLKNAFAASGGSLASTRAFQRGDISIQDESSQAVPLLLGVRAGDRVLDVCAAPGGKTAALARSAGPHGLVIAGELHEHRLRAMREQLQRLRIAIGQVQEKVQEEATETGERTRTRSGSPRVQLVALDASQPLPFSATFDRILVDAPCSGTGTLARHPEIRWRLRPNQLEEFHSLQVKLLRNALAQLAPGGRLVYSTCSMEPEENESVISEVLNFSSSVRIMTASECAKLLEPHLIAGVAPETLVDSQGFFRTAPATNRTDGFFAAVLEKIQ